MTRNYISIIILHLSLSIGEASAQQLLDRVNSPLSPSEERFAATNADIRLSSSKTLYENPAFTEWLNRSDTTQKSLSIVYSGLSSADSKGDFLPYEGNGSTDYRIGAYGEYATHRIGTLSGRIQYSQGKHRNIGWNAMRLPELYLPYISTDSIGGDYKFDSYHAEGNYSFTLNRWTFGARASFYGEQAYRLTDPRALNNTTWLRFNAGAARQAGSHLLMAEAGYGRNKQHTQLRYWRPGQQDRFFVCYGFGLYDTRQSAVSFGKSRMYYVDEFNAHLQYLLSSEKSLRLHASLAYAFDRMKTEESDIYDLYESRSHKFSPQFFLTYDPENDWRFDFSATGNISFRKGYENIIEEYLIDKENNIYDFRTIDTQQNYRRNSHRLTAATSAERQFDKLTLALQAGITTENHEEKYKNGLYRINVQTLTPHVKLGGDWKNRRSELKMSLLYARQTVGSHNYDVNLRNQQIQHLDFQHAFTPYAFRAATLDKMAVSITCQHRFRNLSAGIDAKFYIENGHRVNDVHFTGAIGFPSSAPSIRTVPDKHQTRWGSVTAFVCF